MRDRQDIRISVGFSVSHFGCPYFPRDLFFLFVVGLKSGCVDIILVKVMMG